jgi:hypothetical protein
MTRTTDLAVLFAATALVAASCSSDQSDTSVPRSTESVGADSTPPDPTGGPVRADDDSTRFSRVRLQQFDQCDAFLDHVHTQGAERVGAYGFDDQRYWFDDMIVRNTEMMPMDDSAMEESDDMSAPAPAQTDSVTTGFEGGSDVFSGTNVQVEGVDEPDIVKTDGERVVAVTDSRLVYIDIDENGRAAERRGSVSLNSGNDNGFMYGQELVLAGDRVFVIAQHEGLAEFSPGDVVVDSNDAESSFVGESLPTEPFPSSGFGSQRTVIIEIDISDPDAPRIDNTLNLEGRYVSARVIGDTARVVVSTPPRELGFVYPSGADSEERATETNRELVRETTVEDWLPDYTFTGSDGTSGQGHLVDCDNVHAPGEFAGFDMLSVVTLSTDESLSAPVDTTSVMATGETVYASGDRLYVATNEWSPPTTDEQDRGVWEDSYQTGIHRFSLPADAGAVYEASGVVDGHLLNQFSMHDQAGTFFVATTTGTPWSSESSVSQIVSMRPNGDRLEQVGQVGGLGQGEQIFSVRYVADTAYVVTFRRTDPFYVVDLSSPTDMVVRGELKIPGVSTYLHPISDSLVLGVGQDADQNGFQTGSKVSLFDVSDPADPRELDVWTMPDSGSDAEFDHRAFLWWDATSTAVLPLVSWNDQFAGAVVLNVTADGIEEQGRVSHVTGDEQPVGLTDCRLVTSGELPADVEAEVGFIITDPNSQLQVCGAGDVGGATGMYCDPIPVDDVERNYGIDISGVDTAGVDRFEWCWQDGGFVGYEQRVIRSLVIADQLLTLSPVSFQANALATLDRTMRIDL